MRNWSRIVSPVFCILYIVVAAIGSALATDGFSNQCSSNCDNNCQPHPFSIHDMLAMERISDPQISPSGNWVAFCVRSTDLEANCGRTDIWLARTDGSQIQQLTTNPAGDWNPRWHDAETLFFLSTRSGSTQIWCINPHGGEANQITDLPLDIANLELVPQLDSFIFSLDVYPGKTISETVAIPPLGHLGGWQTEPPVFAQNQRSRSKCARLDG